MAKYVGFKIGKVHENHVISQYYCGGCGYPVTDHDSFCPECGGEFRKCDADDEKIHRLEAENAKLRKLIGRWYPHMRKRVGDDALRQWGHMDIMRELGIEVDA